MEQFMENAQLEKLFSEQSLAQIPLNITLANIGLMFIRGEELPVVIEVQRLAYQYGLQLLLLKNAVVTVPRSEHGAEATLAANLPFCCRQVVTLNVSRGSATLVLHGGNVVEAEVVKHGPLTDVKDWEILCCELVERQTSARMPQLLVIDMLRMSWMKELAVLLHAEAQGHKQVREFLARAGASPAEVQQATSLWVQSMQAITSRLPSPDWINQVLHSLELPLAPAAFYGQQQQLSEQVFYSKQQSDITTWQQWKQHILAQHAVGNQQPLQPAAASAFAPSSNGPLASSSHNDDISRAASVSAWLRRSRSSEGEASSASFALHRSRSCDGHEVSSSSDGSSRAAAGQLSTIAHDQAAAPHSNALQLPPAAAAEQQQQQGGFVAAAAAAVPEQDADTVMQQWLRGLAVKLVKWEGPRKPDAQPHAVPLRFLKSNHPVPASILQRYHGSFAEFVNARPELSFVTEGRHYTIFMIPEHQNKLLAEMQASQ